MSMSRQDYTALAEAAGKFQAKLEEWADVPNAGSESGYRREESGVPDLINDLAEMLSHHGNPAFKPDKFTRHAEVERALQIRKAEEQYK